MASGRGLSLVAAPLDQSAPASPPLPSPTPTSRHPALIPWSRLPDVLAHATQAMAAPTLPLPDASPTPAHPLKVPGTAQPVPITSCERRRCDDLARTAVITHDTACGCRQSGLHLLVPSTGVMPRV